MNELDAGFHGRSRPIVRNRSRYSAKP